MGAFSTQTSAPAPMSPAPQQSAQAAPVSIAAPAEQPHGKGGSTYSSPASGKGGSNFTFPSASGQPQMGVPNKYSNTVQPVDNMQAPAVLGTGRGKGM